MLSVKTIQADSDRAWRRFLTDEQRYWQKRLKTRQEDLRFWNNLELEARTLIQQEARDPLDIERWLAVMQQGFFAPKQAPHQQCIPLIRTILHHLADLHHYTA